MRTVALLAVGGFLLASFWVLWPPGWAPEGWRRLTRPVRHRVRRRYYRHAAPWRPAPPDESTEPGFWEGEPDRS